MFRKKQLEFYFHFDKPDRIYEVGETISGYVLLQALKETRCDNVRLFIQWRTHGKGNAARGREIDLPIELPMSVLGPDQESRLDFSFKAPAGPLTYHGHYLKVDWYLRCIVDIPSVPGFLDPKDETEILLLPKEGIFINQGLPSADLLAQSTPNYHLRTTRGFRLGFGLLIVLGFIAVTASRAAGSGGFPFFVSLVLFAGIGVLIYRRSMRNRFAKRKLGEIEVNLEPRLVLPGEILTLAVHFTPLDELKVNYISFKVQAQEIVISGSGTNKTTYRHTLFENEHEFTDVNITTGEAHDVQAEIPIPFDAPYAFQAANNQLLWFVDIHIDLDRWPNWSQRHSFAVVPWRETSS